MNSLLSRVTRVVRPDQLGHRALIHTSQQPKPSPSKTRTVVHIRERSPADPEGPGTFKVEIPLSLPNIHHYRHLIEPKLTSLHLGKTLSTIGLLEYFDFHVSAITVSVLYVLGMTFERFRRLDLYKEFIRQRPMPIYKTFYGYYLLLGEVERSTKLWLLNPFSKADLVARPEYHLYLRGVRMYIYISEFLHESAALAPFLSDKYFFGPPKVIYDQAMLQPGVHADATPDLITEEGPFLAPHYPLSDLDPRTLDESKAKVFKEMGAAFKLYHGRVEFPILPTHFPDEAAKQMEKHEELHKASMMLAAQGSGSRREKHEMRDRLEEEYHRDMFNHVQDLKIGTVTVFFNTRVEEVEVEDEDGNITTQREFNPLWSLTPHKIHVEFVDNPMVRPNPERLVPESVYEVYTRTGGMRVREEAVWVEHIDENVVHMAVGMKVSSYLEQLEAAKQKQHPSSANTADS